MCELNEIMGVLIPKNCFYSGSFPKNVISFHIFLNIKDIFGKNTAIKITSQNIKIEPEAYLLNIVRPDL